jgi:hypothetical protein
MREVKKKVTVLFGPALRASTWAVTSQPVRREVRLFQEADVAQLVTGTKLRNENQYYSNRSGSVA